MRSGRYCGRSAPDKTSASHPTGRVAETGTHDELLAERGLYARLWDMQFSEDAGTLGTLDDEALAPLTALRVRA